MTGIVHAAIGAAIGSLARSKPGAFAGGVLSHLVADALPHKDLDPKVEAVLVAAALTGLAKWKGTDSAAFWGAIGGILPDTEHALMLAGLISTEQEIFPTHIQNGKYHGADSGEQLSQLALLIAALLVVGNG